MNPKVELLTAAKQYLWDGLTQDDGTYGHICGALAGALNESYRNSEAHKQAHYQLVARIEAHIAPWCYFSTWVKAQANDPYMPRHIVQAKRLEYVEQLIEEFSNEPTPSPSES